MTKSQFREFWFGAKHLTGLLVATATVAVILFFEVGAVGQEAQFPVVSLKLVPLDKKLSSRSTVNTLCRRCR